MSPLDWRVLLALSLASTCMTKAHDDDDDDNGLTYPEFATPFDEVVDFMGERD